MAFQRKKVAVALACAFAGGALSGFQMSPALAQTPAGAVTAPPPAPAGQAPIRVEVTGSNIPRVDAETASPVQVLTAADLQASGYTTVNDVLRDITANGQGLLSQGFNGAFAGGAQGVALRGLNVGNTLVLIDGLRMAPYPVPDDGQKGFVDINSIPFSAVERIEVLLDGASAIYGSDAIGGVVNVILKKNFTGNQLLAEAGTTYKGDGTNYHVAFLTGGATEKMNGFLSFEYRSQEAIFLKDRSHQWSTMDWSGQGGNDLRPGAVSPVQATPILRTPYLQRPGANGSLPENNIFLDPNCNLAARNANQCVYENTWSTIQPPSQNINLLGRLGIKLADAWELVLTGSYFNSMTEQNRRPAAVPAGSFGGNIASGPGIVPFLTHTIPVFRVPATYPGNTFGTAANVRALIPDINNSNNSFNNGTTRLVAELSGSYAGWDINLAAGYTYVIKKTDWNGYPNEDALLAALNDPVNPYKLTGGNSPAINAIIAPEIKDKKTSELDFVQATVTRELMKLDGGPLGIALGASYVYQNLNANNPQECKDGTVALGGICFFTVGKQENSAFFAEINAPVLKSLELGAAVRYDYYDTYGGQWTPKFNLKWTPIKQFALRGTWGQGFRAPYIAENGVAGLAFTASALRDPVLCPVSLPNGQPDQNSPQNVVQTGAGTNPCGFNPTYQQGTTKDLKPEKSDNWTLGIVLEPVPSWSVTADYYSIELKNQIISASNFSNFDPLANAIRGPIQIVTFGDGSSGPSPAGPIAFVNVGYVNASKTSTTGLDFGTTYSFKLPDESRMKLAAQWSHIFTYDLTFEGVKYKLAGTHGPVLLSGDTGNPQDRLQLTAQWTKGPFTATLMGNWISSYDMTDPSAGVPTCFDVAQYANPSRFSNPPPDQYCKVDDFWYWNLNLAYQFNKQTQIRFAVTNLFNQQAPVDIGTYGGTGDNRTTTRGAAYNPSLHWPGVVGTSFLLGLTYNF